MLWSYCGQTEGGLVATGPATEPVKGGADEIVEVVPPIPLGTVFVLAAIGVAEERLVEYEDTGATSIGIW